MKPSPLSNCTIRASINQSSETLEIECIAGYDGGLRQDFRLEAYDVTTRKLRLNISSLSTETPIFRINVADLLPSTHVHLITYALNAKGRSELTHLENIMLKESDKSPGTTIS